AEYSPAKEITNGFFVWNSGIPYGKVSIYFYYNLLGEIVKKNIYREVDSTLVLVAQYSVEKTSSLP
nr:hypothetical protein [Bacteroidota bacterium]